MNNSCSNLLSVLVVIVLVSGCAVNTEYSASFHSNESLSPGDIQQGGLAFITPSTVTGQEQDTQALALAFASILIAERPNTSVVKLSETLSAINKNKLNASYNLMYSNYNATGILDSEILKVIGELTSSRYLVQLKLSHFKQDSKNRLNLLGWRISQTNKANIRLYMQIWDSATGTIAFEGSEEVNLAFDSSAEKAVTFQSIVTTAAKNMIRNLP